MHSHDSVMSQVSEAVCIVPMACSLGTMLTLAWQLPLHTTFTHDSCIHT